MNNKRELLIVQDEQRDWKKGEHEIWHPLYLDGYKVGLKNIFTKAYEEDTEQNRKKPKRIITDEQNNILSFIGKRGSGKTTAMDEFCRILDSLDAKEESRWWIKQTENREIYDQLKNSSFKFHILQPIDASLFDESGDLFEQIIANLYRYFDKQTKEGYIDLCSENNSYAGMYTDIMKRYYSNIGDKANRGTSFSVANMMSFASDNNEIQKKIIELIEVYLGSRKWDYEYIVITIDDIDLNIGLGYKMLEQIQKYFAYSRIIILVSMDYDQMRMVCEKHFWNCLGGKDRITSEKYNQQYIKNLTKDVMTKIFHISQRIYLPDLGAILKETYVKENEHDDEKLIKGYIVEKIVKKLNIYYDLDGMKKHFVEPETIREFVVYTEFLDSLDDIEIKRLDIDPEDALKIYDANYKLFSKDIVERMAQNLLSAEQMVAFRKLQSRDVERRAKYFVNSYIDESGNIIFGNIDEPSNSKKTHLINKRINALKGPEYSYGELLEQIYAWGRIPDRDCFDDKPYIWCVLAMFTTDMTNAYIHFKYDANNSKKTFTKEKVDYKKQLLSFIGDGFGSAWLKDAFPKTPFIPLTVNLSKTTTKDTVNNIKMTNYGFDNSVSLRDLKIVIPDLLLKEKHYSSIELKKHISESHIIQTMALIDMCCSKIVNGEIKRIKFSVKDDTNGLYIGVSSDYSVNLDMMSFAVKAIEYKECQEALINNIKEVLIEILKHVNFNSIDIKNIDIEGFIKEKLPFRYVNKKNKDLYFPFYDLDLSYNVLKRVRNEFKNTSNPAPDLSTAMRRFYGKIAELLENEDKKYLDLGIENPKFRDKYLACPFVKAVLDVKNLDMVKAINNLEEILINNMTLTPGGDAGVAPTQDAEE